jgi:DNA topoisomerase VI subunit B
MNKTVTVEKLGAEPKVEEQKAGKRPAKTFPKGVLKKSLKLKGVTDPAKAPPVKKGMRKHTLKILTEKGSRKYRKTLKKKLSSLSDSKVKEVVQKAGLVTNSKTPAHVSRQILDNAVSAGFVSL